jgi:ureidoacrylate peracid hydrolase
MFCVVGGTCRPWTVRYCRILPSFVAALPTALGAHETTIRDTDVQSNLDHAGDAAPTGFLDKGGDAMTRPVYDKEITALLVIDPYNDFISEGGKLWDRIRAVAEANNCIAHMRQVLDAARQAKLRVFYALHHRYRPGDYETWKYIAPVQRASWKRKSFKYGTWGGEIRSEFEPRPGEIVASEHWCSSGFANMDLDLQLKKHGIHQLIVIGLIAHTCVEATVRFAAELGYDVTVVKDATADYGNEEMHAALEVNMPNYANAIVTTDEIVDLLASIDRVEAPRASAHA